MLSLPEFTEPLRYGKVNVTAVNDILMNNFIRQIEERSFHSTRRKIDMGVHLRHTQNLQTKLSGSVKEDVNQTILLDARTQNYQGDKPQRCVGGFRRVLQGCGVVGRPGGVASAISESRVLDLKILSQ